MMAWPSQQDNKNGSLDTGKNHSEAGLFFARGTCRFINLIKRFSLAKA
jgi:hypothetical protein